jgi:signal transduction histidine kinase/Tfp pilus assembly protein PilF
VPLQSQQRLLDSLLQQIALGERRQQRDTAMLNALIDVAFEYRVMNIDSALLLAERARVLAQELADTLGLATSLNIIGIVYLNKGYYTMAEDFFLQALVLREQKYDTSGIASSLNNLGLAYRALEQYDQALDVFKRALTLYQRKANSTGVLNILTNIGVVYLSCKQFDTALSIHRQALLMSRQRADSNAIVRSYTNVGESFYGLGQMDSAVFYLRQSLNITQRSNNKRSRMIALLILARVQQATKQYATAIATASSALALADSLTARAEQRDCCKLLAALCIKQQHPAAEDYFVRYTMLNDSLTSQRRTQQFAEVQARYELAQKEQSIRLLQRDAEIQRLERSKEGIVRNALLGGVVALLVVVVLGIQRYRIKQRSEEFLRQNNEELQKANQEISRQQQILAEQAAHIQVANTELQESNLRLIALNEEKNEFLGIAAHDMKNPLSAIRMAASMLLTYSDRMSPEQQQQRLRTIVELTDRMVTIITNLLNVNALERGTISPSLESFPILPVVKTLEEQFAAQAAAKNITLQYAESVSDGIQDDVCIYADRILLTEVLENLVSNAIKYSPWNTSVTLRCYLRGESVYCAVHDEGPGLSDEDMKKLFGKFARLSAKPTGGEHSTGLGLSIVKKLVEAMNGHVWCESELGKGAAFIVELPRG